MKKNFFFHGLLLTVGMGVTSCVNHDVYDPDYKTEQYQLSWTDSFGSIDANQDWVMTKQITANLTADDEGTFYLYNGNPVNKNADALLLAKCEAKAGQTTTITFDAPETLSTIYVAHFKDGYLRAVPASIADNKVTLDLNAKAETTQNARRIGAMGELYKTTDIYTGRWNPAMPTRPASSSYDKATKTYYIVGNDADFTTFEAGSIIYVYEGATLKADELTLTNCKLKSEGTVTAAKITASETSVVVNSGNMSVTGDFILGESSQYWNNGTLNVGGDYDQKNNAITINEYGQVNVAGTTITETDAPKHAKSEKYKGEDGGNSTWLNLAKWTTKDMNVLAGSHEYYDTRYNAWRWEGSECLNSCCLTVNGTLTISPEHDLNRFSSDNDDHSFFINDGGCLVKAENVVFNHAMVMLGGNSLFKVTGTATFKEQLFSSRQDIFTGYTTDGTYAVLEMNKAVAEPASTDMYVFTGNIYVACNDFMSDLTDQSKLQFISTKQNNVTYTPAKLTPETNANVHIETSECNPVGYQPVAATVPTKSQYFIFACEDLGSTGDYDFNDVVFSVGYTAGETSATVTAMAAGGTLPATIYFGEQAVGEIHSMLGSTSTSDMINTTKLTATGTTQTITVPSDFSISKYYSRFKVKVQNGTTSTYVTAPAVGAAPMILVVPDTWQWPTERTSIKDAYPNFIKWSADATASDWESSRVDEKTVTR